MLVRISIQNVPKNKQEILRSMHEPDNPHKQTEKNAVTAFDLRSFYRRSFYRRQSYFYRLKTRNVFFHKISRIKYNKFNFFLISMISVECENQWFSTRVPPEQSRGSARSYTNFHFILLIKPKAVFCIRQLNYCSGAPQAIGNFLRVPLQQKN